MKPGFIFMAGLLATLLVLGLIVGITKGFNNILCIVLPIDAFFIVIDLAIGLSDEK